MRGGTVRSSHQRCCIEEDLRLFGFSRKIAHAHISGRQNKNKLKEIQVSIYPLSGNNATLKIDFTDPRTPAMNKSLTYQFKLEVFQKQSSGCLKFSCEIHKKTLVLKVAS